jgi:hypothetical protein
MMNMFDPEDADAALLEYRVKLLEDRITGIEKKLDSANNWLRGVLGSLVLALGMLAFDLLTKK